MTGLLGLIVGYLGAVLKTRLEVSAQVDQQLRTARAEQYKAMWAMTAVLPKWPRRQDATFADLQALREGLRDWYFGGGGLYLSRSSFQRYSQLQDALGTLDFSKPQEMLPSGTYDGIREKCSALRSGLTDDLLSRRGGSLWRF